MDKDIKFKAYLSISNSRFELNLFDVKNFKNLYQKNLKIINSDDAINFTTLSKFLDENIYIIEKLFGKFINNIDLIIKSKKINSFNLSIKKKNYEKDITKKFLQKLLTDTRDLFQENHQNEKILHMIVNRYIIDNVSFETINENLKADHISIEVKFITIPDFITFNIENVLKKYHIQPDDYLDETYIENFFEEENLNFYEKTYKIQHGANLNEIDIIPKNTQKISFFEKFFQFWG
ncbi:hypothetical protein [Candidatus Pelagibacter sp. HIMB1506]|uniref:hypothetical protein n=1 Tax=Candidatus Pelagibacter sp. HIMB1506 TaxID=3413337 RepID=UPI003F830667